MNLANQVSRDRRFKCHPRHCVLHPSYKFSCQLTKQHILIQIVLSRKSKVSQYCNVITMDVKNQQYFFVYQYFLLSHCGFEDFFHSGTCPGFCVGSIEVRKRRSIFFISHFLAQTCNEFSISNSNQGYIDYKKIKYLMVKKFNWTLHILTFTQIV